MTIIWSDPASDDMNDIYDFYLIKSPHTAAKIYNSIIQEAEILKTHPKIAPPERLLEGEDLIFRSLVTKSGLFKIIYFIEENDIFIYRIWCCRADVKRLK